MTEPTQVPNPAAIWGQLTMYAIGVLGFAAAIGRWIAARLMNERLEPITLELETLKLQVTTMESAIKALATHTQAIPEIRAIAERAELSLERTEQAIVRMSDNFLAMAKEVGELRGASKRTRGD